jgi:Protein of unknown function (DUF3126)
LTGSSPHATSHAARARAQEAAVNRTEIWRLEKYLRGLFRLDTITVLDRPQADSVEVHVAGEFIGLIYKNDDEGEVSYDFNMSILEMDLPEPPASRAG